MWTLKNHLTANSINTHTKTGECKLQNIGRKRIHTLNNTRHDQIQQRTLSTSIFWYIYYIWNIANHTWTHTSMNSHAITGLHEIPPHKHISPPPGKSRHKNQTTIRFSVWTNERCVNNIYKYKVKSMLMWYNSWGWKHESGHETGRHSTERGQFLAHDRRQTGWRAHTCV